jgi:hypothetical protein
LQPRFRALQLLLVMQAARQFAARDIPRRPEQGQAQCRGGGNRGVGCPSAEV